MEIVAAQHLQVQPFPPKAQCLMTTPLSFKLAPPFLLRITPTAFRLFATTSAAASPTTTTSDPEVVTIPEPSTPKPTPNGSRRSTSRDKKCGLGLGHRVDPDLSGALAVLKPDNSAEVLDSPHLKVLVGKRVRKRLDAKSIIQLLKSVDAPIEQSIPYPQDGKQGWWSGGFGYGLWIGIMVASGYSVVPVPSFLWKNEFKLAGTRSSKDGSRELASTLFPSMSSLLKRKKDHGRAEALLIAAYGKGLKVNIDSSRILEDSTP
ncbi:hypothetical protein Pfo_017833 [Paulownia fortunei]|nr:hypothetical protein Pfo_017833 [Paulownia fortunei]